MSIAPKIRSVGATPVAALLTRFGTLGLVIILSLLGIGLGIDTGLWVTTIGVLYATALIFVALGARKHGVLWPTVVGTFGLVLVFWALIGTNTATIELLSFMLLFVAVYWDRSLHMRLAMSES